MQDKDVTTPAGSAPLCEEKPVGIQRANHASAETWTPAEPFSAGECWGEYQTSGDCKSHHLSIASLFVGRRVGSAQSVASNLQRPTGVWRLEIDSDCSRVSISVTECGINGFPLMLKGKAFDG